MQSSKLPSLEPELGCWDSVLLEHLSEDNFIANLQQRYKRDHIYTYIGTYLLAVNPYKPLPLYTPDLVQLYATRSLFHLPPHIYSFTNKIFQTLQDYNEDQCIILSGESGAGKTETSRLIIHFLTQIADIKRKLQKQRSGGCGKSRSGRRSSTSLTSLVKPTSKSNSCTSTPKRCATVPPGGVASSTLPMPEKGGCLRMDKNRRRSHEKTVEFDFSHHKSTESLSRQCLKQSTSTSNVYSRSFDEKDLYSTACAVNAPSTTNCSKICAKHQSNTPAARHCDVDNIQYVMKTAAMKHGGSNPKLYCCSDHPSTSVSTSSAYYYAIPKSHHKCNCHEQLNSQQQTSSLSRSILKSSTTHLDALPGGCCGAFHGSEVGGRPFAPQRHDFGSSATLSPKLGRSGLRDSRSTLYSIDEYDVAKMTDRVAQAEIFLEALGNATTARNVNSSRFGKYYDVEVDFKGDTIGGHLTHYMLEKSRITSRNQGERNFHIFYQLLSGADIHFLKTLKLQRNIDRYELLKNSCSSEDDKTSFAYTKRALETIGLAQDEILAIFKIIAVVLKLGNLQFIPTTNIDGTEGCGVSNDYELQEIAQLLNLDESILLKCLIKSGPIWNQIELDTGSELDALKASRIRYILCRTLYGRLFTWVVNRINESLKFKHYNRGKNIGILDFYGFEILDKNAFEQLAINYCNEKFHQFFLQNVLKFQQDLYVHEGLEWTRIDFFDNGTICDLIDKPNFGILSLMDEPRVTCDSTLSTRLQQCCAGHTNFECGAGNLQHSKCFQIRHYAGPVSYSINGFTETNKDFLPKYISAGLFQSNLNIVQVLFPEGNPKRQSKKPTSLGANLRTSLQTLLTIIGNRQLNYVFCIKPNDQQQTKVFDLSSVQHQVRYMSLMPLVHLWRTGYYFNLNHKTFLNRYKLVSPLTWPHYHKGTMVEGIALIIRSVPLPAAEFTIGGKRVFIRSPRTVFELEEIRRSRLDCLATMIQKNVRAYFSRRHFLRMRRSQIVIASAWRTWRECRFGIPYTGRRHMSGLYRAAREQYRQAKYQRQVEWAVGVIQRFNRQWKRRQFLLTLLLRLPANSMSPLSLDWVTAPRFLTETSLILRNIYHKWRCYKYRKRFDQTARNRMREKVTASIIFKDRKISYTKSVSHPFLGDYVRLRQNVQWKKICVESNDQYVVFADIVNKITRSSGKYVPILLVLSTSSMLLLDQRTLQIKYRIPASEIYRMSLSPYLDDIAVFHVKADNHPFNDYSDGDSDSLSPSGCLFQSEYGKKKGDFVFQTNHVIEIVTKLFLVVQNATSKPPDVHISTDFEANFGQQTVIFTFKCTGMSDSQTRVTRKGNRMEVTV